LNVSKYHPRLQYFIPPLSMSSKERGF